MGEWEFIGVADEPTMREINSNLGEHNEDFFNCDKSLYLVQDTVGTYHPSWVGTVAYDS